MQLPTSVAANAFYTPSVNRQNLPVNGNPGSSKDPVKAPPERPERAPAQAEGNSPQSPQTNDLADSERVVPAQKSEVPTQDLAPRERQAQSTGNASTDQYQQIARQGVQDAQGQDPSLFRIDVYV